ncbi:hypothetical protein, partial [Klebsiella variicola]|uniref:hypothetical protein n=1 Tax=Klebsiella variicola TaxID=244366 RepID=UPI001C6FCC4A
ISKLALVLDIYSSLSLIWRYSYCPVFQGATSGTHGILVDLKFQEQVLFTTTGGSGVTLTNPQWRFGLEA